MLEIGSVIKVAIGHYYFGYIHPFYDGNGRTSRFISSMYLCADLGDIAALSLSRGRNTYRNKYVEAFEITNSIKSRGELNCFIETFITMILEALIQMNAELREKSELLNRAQRKLNTEPRVADKDHIYVEILYVLAQNYFFDVSSGLTIKELAKIFEKSEATLRKIMKELHGLSLVEQKGERPIYYCIKQTYLEV